MSHIESIVAETIGVLLAPYHLYDPKTYLCPYHGDERVRSVIHSLLRMESCRVHPTGVLSPCFPSTGHKDCRNSPCPYVIGHSIYLWVGTKRSALHKGETGGCGCTFKHSKQEMFEVRDRVFEYLDANYGLYSVIESPPLRALVRIELFRRDIVQARIAGGAVAEMTYTFNVSTMKPSGVMLFKSDDTIFIDLTPPSDEEQAEGEEETQSNGSGIVEMKDDPPVRAGDTERFPKLPVILPARKAASTRKDLPYQVDGI